MSGTARGSIGDAGPGGAGRLRPPRAASRGRRRPRALAACASLTFAAALLAGCGGTDPEEPPEESGAAEESAPEEDRTSSAPEDDSPSGENLFEGTWGFGHDSKELDAEELAALLEEEAEARGPEEMSLQVECGDGVDTGAGDDSAECIAVADEGVEHLWLVTVGPADAGLEIQVENAG